MVEKGPGEQFGYLVRRPGPSRGATGLAPTIVYLHGFGERGSGTRMALMGLGDTGLPHLALVHQLPTPALPFLILAPQTDGTTWNVGELRHWLARMQARYPIDPARLYLTGISMGGGGVVSYLDAFGPRTEFAAAAPISGDWTPPGSVLGLPSCARLGPTPIWAFAGDIDDVVPHQFSINLIGYLTRHCPAARNDRLTVYAGRFHDVWSRTYDLSGEPDRVDPPWQPYSPDIYTWFLQHRLG